MTTLGMKRLRCLHGVLSVVLCAGPLWSQQHGAPPDDPARRGGQTGTILILAFDNATGRATLDAVAAAVSDLVAAFLVAGADRVRVVDRRVLEEIYRERRLTWRGFVAAGSERRAGALSQAGYILRGSLRRRERSRGELDGNAGTVELQAFLHETASTRLLKSFAAHGAPGEIIRLCREVAADVATFFEDDLPPMEDLPLDEDPQKSLLMIHGLSAFQSGRYPAAMSCFLKVLEGRPDDETASFWLARSFLGGGFEGHAKLEFELFLERFPRSDRTADVKRLLTSIQQKERTIHDEQ